MEDQLIQGAVRTIPAKSIGNRGFFPSNKVHDGIVEYESQIERDFFILLEHAPDVELFQHQPLSIKYKTVHGNEKTYTPDVYIQFTNGQRAIVEIKDRDTVHKDSSKYLERWEACLDWCTEQGIKFLLLTENEIRKSRFYNIWLTIGSSKNIANDQYLGKVLQLIPKDGMKFNQFCEVVSTQLQVNLNKASQIICYSIYHGSVYIHNFSDKLIDGNSVIYKLPNGSFVPFNPLYEEISVNSYDSTKSKRNIPNKDLKDIEVTNFNNQLMLNDDPEVKKKELIVKEFLSIPHNKRNTTWRQKISNKHKVGISTIYSWVKSYKKSGRIGLKDQHHKKGRNKSWDSKTTKIFEAARKKYLEDDLTIKNAYGNYVVNKWERTVAPPSISSFWRYIQQHTSYYQREISKSGKQVVNSLEPSLKSFRGAVMPMQVLQFDNTPFDLFVHDSDGVSIGTQNLCAAIDVYTRMITGFELTLNPINRQSVLSTLVQSILPKEEYIKNLWSHGDYKPNWEIQGYPVLILVDNGMDYRSKDVKRFCMDHDIILEFAPLATPRYKAYIENFFNILKSGIRFELDGMGHKPSLHKRLNNRNKDLEVNAIFNAQQSEIWLTSWILDEYHYTNPYSDGSPAPFIRYEEYEKSRTPIILPQPRDPPNDTKKVNLLKLDGLVSTTRTLKNNIEFMNLRYSSPKLIEMFRKIGKQRITVLYDTRDIRIIWVKHPITLKIMELHLTNGWARAIITAYEDLPISLSFWKREVKLMRQTNRSKLNLSIFRKERGVAYRKELRNSSKRSKRSKRSSEIMKENKRKSLHSQISKESDLNPEITNDNDKDKSVPKFKKREIDWSEIEKLPTDDMYKG